MLCFHSGDAVMIEGLANSFVDYLDRENYLKEDREIYLHGTKLIISELLGTIVLLVIGLITGNLIEAIIYEVVISTTRSIMGGYHSNSYVGCIGVYSGFFLIGVIFLNYHHFSLNELLIIAGMGSLNIFVLAPVDHVNKVASVKKRQVYKLYSRITLLIYLIIMAALFNWHSRYLDIFIYIFIVINILLVKGKIDYEKLKK